MNDSPVHPEGFSRPPTLAELAGYAAERWLRRLGILLLVLALLVLAVVGVPVWTAARSHEYACARAFVEGSFAVSEVLGPVVSIDRFPRSYRLGPGPARFSFGVVGTHGEGRADVVVERVPPPSVTPDGPVRLRVVEGTIVGPRGGRIPIAPGRRRR